MLPVLLVFMHGAFSRAAEPPQMGNKAPDIEPKTPEKEAVRLSELTSKVPVAVLVLHGYPSYQCPICNKQVGKFVNSAEQFAKSDARIVFVYPGPADKQAVQTKEFITGKTLPDNVLQVINPDCKTVKCYGQRWDAPRETACPSPFVIDRDQSVQSAKVSETHGGRSNPSEVLAQVQKPK